MMETFTSKIQEQFKIMCSTGKLFRVKVTGREVWRTYLESFTDGTDPVFRDPESSTHNCNYCHNFIRRYGNVVAINKNGDLITLFSNLSVEAPYEVVANACDTLIKGSKIENVFLETYKELQELAYDKCEKTQPAYKLGVARNHKRYTKEEAEQFGVVKANQVVTFNHLHVNLPKAFVYTGTKSLEAITAEYRDKHNVFKRGIKEISLDTLILVKDLIQQGSLLDGTAHLHAIKEMSIYKRAHELAISTFTDEDNWFWVSTYDMDERVAKFKNTLMGVLCTELSEGKEINEACKSWNKRVDPANYHKASAPISKRQIAEAQKFVEDNGYAESFNRRLATIDDIKVLEILHSNVGDGALKKVSLFDNIKPTSTRHKKSEFKKVEEISIKKFIEDILPGCTSIEAFLKNSHEGNMVTMTTTVNKNSKRIFKWHNNYSWTFSGNLAGKSQLTQMVEDAGGRTDGAFRFTHSWNEIEPNASLMDLHVFMPGNNHTKGKIHESYGTGRRVGWNHRKDSPSGASQDVDYTQPAPANYVPVENITFPSLSKMPDGKYVCKIHNWNFRETGGRGKAEIAFGGEVYHYEYPATKHHEWVTIAEVILKDGKFFIEHKLPETNPSKDIYGLETNNFHKVNLVCLSPNHWGDDAIGNLHYMFMLDKCKTSDAIRGFHNENLLPDLLKHKKVMEVLGNSALIESTNKQLSGLGFNSTVKDELVVKVKGSFQRILKIKF